MDMRDLFIERNNILESLDFECFDSLDYLYESIDLLLEADDNQNNNNTNNNSDSNSLREDDRRIKFDAKKLIGDMIRILIEWFTKLKNVMINFFKGFKNINHKNNIKKIFTDKDKLNKKIKVFNYMNMRNGITAVEKMMSQTNSIFRNYMQQTPDMAAYKNEVMQKIGFKMISGNEIKSKVTSCFIRNNEKIKIRIGQLNEQIVASYLIDAERSVASIDVWRDNLKQDMQRVNTRIDSAMNAGRMTKDEAKKMTTLLKAHTNILEKMAVCTMKCIKKGFSDFNKIVNKGNGTTDNLDEEREQIEKDRAEKIKGIEERRKKRKGNNNE